MSITARMRVADLLEQHPDAQDVFDSYGIELDDESMNLTLDQLCKEEAINYWELKSDIALSEGWDGATPGFDGEDASDDDEDEEDWEEGDDDDGDDDDLEDSELDDEWDEDEEEDDEDWS